jgi:hypothetical protein
VSTAPEPTESAVELAKRNSDRLDLWMEYEHWLRVTKDAQVAAQLVTAGMMQRLWKASADTDWDSNWSGLDDAGRPLATWPNPLRDL